MEKLNLIIDSQTKRLRNGINQDNASVKGILLYVHDEFTPIPSGHEIVEGFVSDIEGKYLPMWNGTEWVESATPEEIEIINRYDGGGNVIRPTTLIRSLEEQVTELQLLVADVCEKIPKMQDSVLNIENLATIVVKKDRAIEDIPAQLRQVVEEVAEELRTN